MNWSDVGQWIKDNAAPGVALVGSLLTGNVPAAVAAGVALVGSATGQATPENALLSLQNDPATMIRLKELALQEAESVRRHVEAIELARLQDAQKEQEQTQETIRNGDNATDEYVRRTRPKMARESWAVTAAYVVVFEGAKAVGLFSVGAVVELALVLFAPAAAYLGLRAYDKRNELRAAIGK